MAKRTRAVGILAATALFASVLGGGAAPQLAAAAPATSIETTPAGAPATIPALQNWTAGTGQFQFTTGTKIVGGAEEAAVAAQIATGLSNELEQEVAVGTSGAKAGDIELVLDETADDLGAEGYRLTVTDKIVITADSEVGLFYGGQTATQWATLAGLGKFVPAGSTTDIPQYEKRGVGICACIVNVSMEKFEETIREMAYYKMNELWLEIKVESPSMPEATFWSYYTTEQAQYISELAAEHNVEIVAEVNSPGHMGPWLQGYPELMLKNKNNVPQPTQLDITKPEALDVVTTLADEYFDHFPEMDYWHMGADEYLLGSGSMADYPQFAVAARNFDIVGGNPGKEIDVFIDFINQVNDHVKSKGKQLRIWNDGLKAYNNVILDNDIVVEHWTNSGQSPKQILDRGNDMVNADGRFYFTRNGAWGSAESAWTSNWTPKRFSGSSADVDDSAAGSGKILGAKLSLWPDNGPGKTENTLFAEARDTMLYVAQATWGSPRPAANFAGFKALGEKLGRGPNTTLENRTPVPAGEYVIGANDLFLTAGAAGQKITATAAKSTWALSTTADGYYKVASGTTCLVPTGSTDLTLNTPQKFGDKPEAQACAASGPQGNLQKWSLRQVDGGYTLVNAITQLPLYVADDGTVTQDDPNKKTASVFKFIGDGVSTSTDFSGRFVAGVTSKLNITVRNLGEVPATDVVVTPELPEGWLASPGSINVGDLAVQGVKNYSFNITPNAGPASLATLEFVTTFKLAGVDETRTASVPTIFSCAANVTSPSEVVRFSSEQNDSNEVAKASAAIDGNPNTFWHTQWSPSEAKFPHELAVGLAAPAELCAVNLTPRQGVSSGAANGQIKDYDLYATTDRAVAEGTDLAAWGAPIKSGSLPSGQSTQWVAFDKVVTAQYLLLVTKSAQVATQNYTTLGEFAVDQAPADTTAPVVLPVADVSAKQGEAVSVAVQAADASSLTYSAAGLPAGLSIDPATGVISGTPTATGTATVTVTVTDAQGNKSDVSFTITVTADATPTPTPTPTPTVKPTPTPTPTPTTPPVVEVPRSAPYTLPGLHRINGRTWYTKCESYSQTERCRTDLWATTVTKTTAGFEVKQGWAFNNMTYLPMMTRAQWAGNPLGKTGSWTATDGREWRTECDTAATGQNGCRSYTMTTVYSATPKAGGGYTFAQDNQWVFNNIVQFASR